MPTTVKALIRFLMILIFLATLLNIANAAAFSGIGDGTANNPFQITTVSQLDEVRHNLSANYILMNDLDLNGFSSDWIPLGFSQPYNNSQSYDDFESFTGVFDGNNKTIYNLTINETRSEIGFFCCIESEGKIFNLKMENAKVIGEFNVGVIAGIIRFSGSAVNCRVINSTVIAFDNGGGLTGSNFDGFVDSCSVLHSNIISSEDVILTNSISYGNSGGLVAGNNCGIIVNSKVENTTIQSQCSAGGIVGVNRFSGIVENSSAINCSIKSEASLIQYPLGYCGGIAGVNVDGGRIVTSSAVNCSVKLEASLPYVPIESSAGGIVGDSLWGCMIADCQASGEIENNGLGGGTGGIVGNASSTTIINCSSFSSVTSSCFGEVGGIAGSAENCAIENCSVFNSEINQIESFHSIRDDYSFISFISLKIKSNIGYIVGDSSKNKINNCVYSDKIKSNKHIFKKNGSKKVNYVDDWTGFII